jgi:hypothetical protein
MGYGSFADRTLAENEPPVYVPEYFSATLAPSGPALPGKLYEWWIEVMPFPFVDRKRVVWAVLMGGCQSYVST